MSMPKLIILEGPSGAGKTSFLNRFMKDNKFVAGFPEKNKGYMTTHFGRAEGRTSEEVGNWYGDILEFTQGTPMILDRYVMSNLIYSHCIGNQTSAGSAQTTQLFRRIKFWYGDSFKTLVFTAEPHILDQRNVGRNREDFMASLPQVVKQYRQFAALAGWMNCAHVNTSHATADETYSYCMDMINV